MKYHDFKLTVWWPDHGGARWPAVAKQSAGCFERRPAAPWKTHLLLLKVSYGLDI